MLKGNPFCEHTDNYQYSNTIQCDSYSISLYYPGQFQKNIMVVHLHFRNHALSEEDSSTEHSHRHNPQWVGYMYM